MLLTENELRRVIRSVIIESLDKSGRFNLDDYNIEIKLDGFNNRRMPHGHDQSGPNDCLDTNNFEYYRSALMLSLANELGIYDYSVINNFDNNEFIEAMNSQRKGNKKQLLPWSCIEDNNGGFTLYFKHMHSNDVGRLIATPATESKY